MRTQSKFIGITALIFAIAFSFTACNTAPKDSKDMAEDSNNAKFDTHIQEKNAQLMVDLVAGQYAEIRLSRYAQMKSQNADIKSTSAMMITDHSAMLGNLRTMAAQKNITVPNEDSTMVNNKIDNWKNDKPMEFDKDWNDQMISMHNDDIKKMRNAVDDKDCDADIKNLINNSLPTVQMHLDKLNQNKDMLDKMK